MKRDSSNGKSELPDFLLMPPAATVISLGMILPEYWLILVFGAFFVKMILVIVQKSTAARISDTSDDLAMVPDFSKSEPTSATNG
jgi:hypothetical protein